MLAEFCSYIALDVVRHIDLAVEARVKHPKEKRDDAEAEAETDSETDAERQRKETALELVDVGDGCADDAIEATKDIDTKEVLSFRCMTISASRTLPSSKTISPESRPSDA